MIGNNRTSDTLQEEYIKIEEKIGKPAVKAYMTLFLQCKMKTVPSAEFYKFNHSLVSGNILYIKNKFIQRTFFLVQNKKLVAAAIYFKAKDNLMPNTLGGTIGWEQLTADDSHTFLDLISVFVKDDKFLFPMNGHINLSYGALFPKDRLATIGILTSGYYPSYESFFSYKNAEIVRVLNAFETTLTLSDKFKLELELSERPNKFSTRNISRIHFRKDLKIYNDLINSTMGEHYNFFPMSEEENWDLMSQVRPLVSPSLFKFLLYEGREIGFCFAMQDFNQVLTGSTDFSNYFNVLFKRSKINRGRILSSGIIKEFQGLGLFKYVRNEVLLEFIARGIKHVESSYIDQENCNSIGNVKSKGAQLSRQYALFRKKEMEKRNGESV